MKKLFSAFLIAFLAIAMAFTCVACNDSGDDASGENSGDKGDSGIVTETFKNYRLDHITYYGSGIEEYIDINNMSSGQTEAYDSTIKYFGKTVQISTDTLKFVDGLVVSQIADSKYYKNGEDVVLDNEVISSAYNHIKLNNGVFSLGSVQTVSGQTIGFALNYYVEGRVAPSYTVTFDSQGGSDVSSQSVKEFGYATEPKAPTRLGYVIYGWYSDKDCKNSWSFTKNRVVKNITLYAKWEEDENYIPEIYLDEEPLNMPTTEGLGFTKIAGKDEYECTGIGTATATEISIPVFYDGCPVTSIAANAFKNNENITVVVIPIGVTTIGSGAFANVKNLTRVVVGNGVTTIGMFAFQNDKNLTSVTLGRDLTKIEGYAFSGCSNISKVVYKGSVKNWCEIVFDDSTSNPCYNGCDLYVGNKLLNDLTVPSSITTINRYAFYGCESLKKVTLTSGLQYIDESAFSGCKNIKNINIPRTVTNIERNAFQGCKGLDKIFIPKNVTYMGYTVFRDCGSMTVCCEAPSEPAWWDTYWASMAGSEWFRVYWGYSESEFNS